MPSVPRCPILSATNSLVTAAVVSPVMPITLSSPSLTLPNLTRTHHQMSWHVPDSAAMTSITLDPQTSRQQNRARFCKICQRESSSPACPWRRSLPCLLCCSAPGGRSCHPSFSPQSSCKTSAIRTVLGPNSRVTPHMKLAAANALSVMLWNGASGLVRCCLWLLQLHQH